MTNKDAAKQQVVEPNNAIQQSATGPLVFISHDGRDADFADAFSKLLKSVSAGMLKSFRSSDKKGTEGIEFGDEWFKRLMEKLKVASDECKRGRWFKSKLLLTMDLVKYNLGLCRDSQDWMRPGHYIT